MDSFLNVEDVFGGTNRRDSDVVVNWLPPTPSSGSTSSTFGIDWLKKNKQKCNSCSNGGLCCHRNFAYPCALDCECALTEAWANLTVADDQRRVIFKN